MTLFWYCWPAAVRHFGVALKKKKTTRESCDVTFEIGLPSGLLKLMFSSFSLQLRTKSTEKNQTQVSYNCKSLDNGILR